MAEIRTDQLLLPSVLDRLIDQDPQVRQEAARGRSQLLKEMKLAVRRDLENLLNTRVRCVPWPAELTELQAVGRELRHPRSDRSVAGFVQGSR